jgi:hypothetical protein
MRRTLAIDEKSYGPDHFPRSSNTLSGIQQRPADELFFGGLAGIAEPIGSSTVSVRPDQVHLSADGWCDALPLKVRTDGILRADLVGRTRPYKLDDQPRTCHQKSRSYEQMDRDRTCN